MNKYNQITSGYERERIPYSTNKAIKQYIKGIINNEIFVIKVRDIP